MKDLIDLSYLFKMLIYKFTNKISITYQLTRLVLVVGGSVVADQMARNPVRVLVLLVFILRLTEFVFVMMEIGVDISDEVPFSPQYFSPSIFTQSSLHDL